MASIPSITFPVHFTIFITLSITIPLLFHLIFNHTRRSKFLKTHPSRTTGPSYPLHPLLLGLDFTFQNALNILTSRFASGIHAFFQSYGPTFSAHIIRKKVILTIKPENLECIMSGRRRFEDYTIIPARKKLIKTLFGVGIFAATGHEWRTSKRLIRSSMSRLHLDPCIYERHFRSMIDEIRSQSQSPGFEFRDLGFRYTLAVSSALIIGEEVDGEGMRRFGEDFGYLGQISSPLTIFNGQVPFLANILFGRRFSDARSRVCDFVDRQVRLAMGRKVGDEMGGRQRSVLEGLVGQTGDGGRVRRECLNLLLAGHATVGISLSELFWYLARYPDVWGKLRGEVAGLEGRMPTFAELKSFTYLKWIINEVTRLRPTLSVHGRITVNDTVLPRGGGPDGSEALFVEKGTYVVYSNYALHRNPAVFGADVEEFRPERWADINPSRYEYLPFGAGPRACPGKEMGWTMVAYATVRLAQEIERIKAVDEKPWEEAVSFSFFNRHGVWVRMVPAGEAA